MGIPQHYIVCRQHLNKKKTGLWKSPIPFAQTISLFIQDPSTSFWQPEQCLTRITNIWKASINFQLSLMQSTAGNTQTRQFKGDHQQALPTRILGLLM